MLAFDLDPTVAGVLYLIAVVLFVLAAFWSYGPIARRGDGPAPGINLVALGLALCFFVPMWENFAAG